MGAYISLEMDSLKEGTEFKKNQVITYTKSFDKNGIYCSGRNAFIAVMNYMGSSHEDSYVISEEMAGKMTRSMVKELPIVIPPNTKILKIEKEFNKHVNKNDILVEFTYEDDLEQYLELNQIDGVDEEEVLSMFVKGKNSIKLLSQEGEIVDIKVYINNKIGTDQKITSFHKELSTRTKDVITKLSSNAKTEDQKLKAIDNLSLKFLKIGGHKLRGGSEFYGARIVYYIKQKTPLDLGDKLATRYGAKGVIGQVIKKEDAPKPKFSPRIDMFISPIGVFSRKNIAIKKSVAL